MANGIHKYIRDMGFALASLVISTACHFILRVFLSRYMGAEDLGLYTLAFTVYSIGMLLSGFGLGPALTKYVAQFKEDIAKIGTFIFVGSITSFVIGAIMGVVLFSTSTLIAVGFFNMPKLADLLRIVAIVFPFIGLEKAILGYFNGLRQMRLFAGINISQNVLTIVLTLVMVTAGTGLSGAVFSFILPVILLSLLSLFSARKAFVWPGTPQYTPIFAMLLSFGGYVILANGVDAIQGYTGTIMIGHFLNAADVGYFSVAVMLSSVIFLIPSAIQTIATPVMASYYGKGDIQKIEEFINGAMKYTAALLIPIAFILTFLSKDIIVLIFGDGFVTASLPLQILLIGSLCAGIPVAIGSALSSTAFVNIIFILSIIGFLLNIAVNWLLIPLWGINGAAIATSSTMIIRVALSLYFIQRLIGIKIQFSWFVKLFIVVALLMGTTYVLSIVFNLYIVVFIAATVLVYILLRFFNSKANLQLIKAFWGKGNSAE